MKKKILSLILALSMVFSLSFALVSCSGKDDDDDGVVVTTVETKEAWSAAFNAETLATAVIKMTFSGSIDGESMSISVETSASATSVYTKMDMTSVYEGETVVTKLENNVTDMSMADLLSGMGGDGATDILAESGLTIETLTRFADLFDKATYADGKYTITGDFTEDGEGNPVFDPTGNDVCVFEFANGKLAKVSASTVEEDGGTASLSFEFTKYGKVTAQPVSTEVVYAYTTAKNSITSDVTAMLNYQTTLTTTEIGALLDQFSTSDVKCYTNVFNSRTSGTETEAEAMTMIFFNAQGKTLTLGGQTIPCKVLGVLVQNDQVNMLQLMNESIMDSQIVGFIYPGAGAQ